jgi:hypothetical protein
MKTLTTLVGVLLVGAVAAQEAPTLSELDRLRVQLHQAEIELELALANGGACRMQLRSVQLAADESALKTEIEVRYPGFAFDPVTGQFTVPPSPVGNDVQRSDVTRAVQ